MPWTSCECMMQFFRYIKPIDIHKIIDATTNISTQLTPPVSAEISPNLGTP